MLRRLVLVSVLSIVPVAAQRPDTFPARALGVSSMALRQTMADYWEWRLADEPELATRRGRHEYDDRWTDWSAAARERRRERQEEFLREMRYVGAGNLTRAEHLSADLLEHELRTQLEAGDLISFVTGVQQIYGFHNRVFLTVDQMPARTPRDYERIIARLGAVPDYVDRVTALLREQLDAGLAQPAVVVDLVLAQVAAQAGTAAGESPLLQALGAWPEAVPASERDRLRREAVAAYEQRFVPAWRRLEAFLRAEYRPRARPEAGIHGAPGGRALYATLVEVFTTTDLDAAEIHEIGLREVARIEASMQEIVTGAGFDGTVAEYAAALAGDPAMRFADREGMLAYARDVLARVEPEMPGLFGASPRMSVGIRPIPPDREAASPSSYTAGAPDGSRQAWFNLNTYRPEDQDRYTVDALVLHETLPGHHQQVALARELEDVPAFRRAFGATAFSEGWALYAESLGVELGVYREPATRFGQLESELFRAVRLVVDTGIHEMGWSRDQARAYLAGHVPSQSLAEVDRYIAWPGQALSYKIGELTIRDLRRRAEAALGPDFDPRAFHDLVLGSGALTQSILEQQVEAVQDPSADPAPR
jgi:uncharacterized protein (DUF885 family)